MQQDRRDTPGRAGRACGARRDNRHAFQQHSPKVTQQAGRRLNCRIGTSHDFTIHAKQNVEKLRKSLVLIQFDCATVWMGVADPVTSLTNFFHGSANVRTEACSCNPPVMYPSATPHADLWFCLKRKPSQQESDNPFQKRWIRRENALDNFCLCLCQRQTATCLIK
jgi:hypothetical protein